MFGNLLAQSFLECAWVWQSRPLCGGGLPVFIYWQLHISDKINWTLRSKHHFHSIFGHF